MNSSYLNDLLEIVQSLDEVKSELRGKKIFITGGTGFLGRWLVDTLVQLGVKPTLLARNRAKAIALNADWIEGDLNQMPTLEGKFDVVIHAANDLSFSADASLLASKHIFDFAERAGAKRVLFLSSGAVYSSNPSSNSYASGKILVEQEGIERASRGAFEFKIARCFAFLGPHQDLDSHFAATQFFKNAIEGNPITIQGDGSAIRSYLYPTDFVVGVIKILLKGRSQQPYDLGSNEPVKIIELAKMINHVGEVKVLNQNTKSLSQTDIYLPNLELIAKELNFKQKISLAEAVKRTTRFYQEIFPNSKIRA